LVSPVFGYPVADINDATAYDVTDIEITLLQSSWPSPLILCLEVGAVLTHRMEIQQHIPDLRHIITLLPAVTVNMMLWNTAMTGMKLMAIGVLPKFWMQHSQSTGVNLSHV
jgi:hypothetical protein